MSLRDTVFTDCTNTKLGRAHTCHPLAFLIRNSCSPDVRKIIFTNFILIRHCGIRRNAASPMNPIVYVVLVVLYVIVMLAVGFWCMKRTRDVGDFFLGGRTLGPWMSAFAYGTTYFSAVLFIGYAGKLGWGFGIYTMWIVLGNTLIGRSREGERG